MLVIHAMIRMRAPEDGGMKQGGFSGMRPSICIGNDLMMCRVTRLDGGAKILVGEDAAAMVEIPYAEERAHELRPGSSFRLQIASRVIADGRVIEKTLPG